VGALDEREARDLVTAYESTNHREWLSPIYGYEPFLRNRCPATRREVLVRRVLVRLLPGADEAMTDVAASRLMRALLAAALALAVTAIGTRSFGARSGWLAGCVMASSLGLPLAARADGVQVYATLLAWLGIGQWIALLRRAARVPNVSLTRRLAGARRRGDHRRPVACAVAARGVRPVFRARARAGGWGRWNRGWA
jgi:hypothetical protein